MLKASQVPCLGVHLLTSRDSALRALSITGPVIDSSFARCGGERGLADEDATDNLCDPADVNSETAWCAMRGDPPAARAPHSGGLAD
jgi:hypothetical protein